MNTTTRRIQKEAVLGTTRKLICVQQECIPESGCYCMKGSERTTPGYAFATTEQDTIRADPMKPLNLVPTWP